MSEFKHIAVLFDEVIEHLNINPEKLYIDGTCGAAGHSQGILEKLNNNGKLLSFDHDEAVIQRISKLADSKDNWSLVHSNFRNIWNYAKEEDLKINGGILLDLGLSSIQLDDPERGFSFNADTRLDMRMDTDLEMDAHDVINKVSEKELAEILFIYGEERKSRLIAKLVCQNRPINTCQELADLIKSIYAKTSSRKVSFKIHPATKTFQALRIYVNQELEALKEFLELDFSCLEAGTRIAIISFHSLEDRMVKNVFRELKQEDKLKIISKKPLIAQEQELEANPRSRSAKLRIAEVL